MNVRHRRFGRDGGRRGRRSHGDGWDRCGGLLRLEGEDNDGEEQEEDEHEHGEDHEAGVCEESDERKFAGWLGGGSAGRLARGRESLLEAVVVILFNIVRILVKDGQIDNH